MKAAWPAKDPQHHQPWRPANFEEVPLRRTLFHIRTRLPPRRAHYPTQLRSYHRRPNSGNPLERPKMTTPSSLVPAHLDVQRSLPEGFLSRSRHERLVCPVRYLLLPGFLSPLNWTHETHMHHQRPCRAALEVLNSRELVPTFTIRHWRITPLPTPRPLLHKKGWRYRLVEDVRTR